MIFAFLFGLLLIVAQMTALRGDDAIGVIDIMLVVGALLAGAATLLRPRALNAVSVNRGMTQDAGISGALSHPVAVYGLWSALAIIVSVMINGQNGTRSFEDLTASALPFLATSVVIICFMTVMFSRNETALQIGFTIGALFIGLVYAFGVLTGSAVMFLELRFTGFASNPNQIAMQALAVLLVLATVLIKVRSKIVFFAASLAIPLTILYGLATGSDAFLVCLLPAIAVFGMIILNRYNIKLWIVIVVGALLALGFLLSLAVAFPSVFGSVTLLVQGQLTQGNQDTDRALLWDNGWLAWSYSPWFGNGPGAWSGVGGPFQGIEAHNSMIDWLSIAGLFGAMPILIILRSTLKSSDDFKLLRIIGMASLIIFTLFHFVFRVPIFWFAVATLLSPFIQSKPNHSRRFSNRLAR